MDLTDKYPKCRAYPPGTNWFCRDVAVTIEPYFYLYATLNCIVILDLKEMRYFKSFAVSESKIVAVAAHETFCFTATSDNLVRAWNIILGTPITSHTSHKAEITSLRVFREGTVLISGDKSGNIVLFEPFGKRTVASKKVSAEVTCIACTKVDGQDYAAIGYANGLIVIEHITESLEMVSTYRVGKSVNDSIQSLDWQYRKDGQWPLLASSTKKYKDLVVWSVPSESVHRTIKLPHPPPNITEQQKRTLYIEVAWSPKEARTLYFSSYTGSIVCCEVNDDNTFSYMKNKRLDKHTRNVFSMHWFHGGDRCITTSLDKRIIRWNVKSREPFQILNTQNAFPYCLDSPVWNIGEIGVAMGDGCIKQWNYSNVNSIMRSNKPHNYYDSNVFWKGLSGHIKNIQYHPTRENILAYTTSNGNIGIYDTVKNQCTQFKYYYSNSESVGIYWALDMSSVLGNPHMTDALISCNSEGEIIALDSNKHTSQAIVINSVLERLNPGWINSIKEKVGFMRTCMAIDENRKYIAFGHKDGLVEVYMLDTLKIVFASNYHIRNITSMDWKILGNNIWLATGSGDGKIGIHQLTITIESYSEDKHQIVPSSHIFRTLMKDNSPVSTVKWSHDPDKAIIAAGSFSSFVTVWDISDKKRVSVFTQHRDRVISVCWSRLELDNLFTGSEDRFIYEFDYKDYLCTEPLNNYISMSAKEKAIYDSASMKRKRENTATSQTILPNKRSGSTKVVFAKVIVDAVTSSSRIQLEAHALSIAGKALEKNVNHSIKYLLDRLTREEQCDPMVEEYSSTFMTKEERSEDKKGEVIHMMFGDKNDIHQLLAIEAHAMDQRKVEESTVVHSVKNNLLADYDMKLAMDIMQGHYQTMGDGPGMDTPVNISDWIMLALSPMVGKETWIKAMKNQADRLRKNGHYHLAASCYIACSHIYDAVAVYRDHSMFREAIVLAKLRLPVDDPILIPLYREWASDLQSKNEDELAAICHLLSGAISPAIDSLARSGGESALFAAACLSHMTNDKLQGERIAHWIHHLNGRLINVKKST